MKPISCNLIRSTAAVCVLMVSGFVHAEDGVVRISDKSSSGAANSGTMPGGHRLPVRTVNYTQAMPAPVAESAPPVQYSDNALQYQPVYQSACGETACCPAEGPYTYGRGYLMSEGCQAPQDCCVPEGCCVTEGCQAVGGCNGQCCGGNCECQTFGNCHQQNMNCLFAGSECSGSGCPAHDFWRGQSMSFQRKNARLANLLFGWMIPSGCCGQGCPPCGKYQVTYADQPDYADPRDSQMYAAQGYGMPMTVPLAPNVQHQYNYSWGVPASRITPISTYNPQTSPRPLYHQTW